MTRRTLIPAVLLAALAALPAPAAAQGEGDLLIRECHTQANEILRDADAHREKGEYEEAVFAYQQVLQDHAQALFPLGAAGAGGGTTTYIGAADYVEERLGSLPDEAKDLYARLFEARARALLDEGRDLRRPEVLVRAATLYPVAPSGIAALGLLARRDLQEGRWPEAAARFQAVLLRDRLHWERRVPEILSLGLALYREGSAAALARLAEDVAARLPGDAGRRTAARLAAVAGQGKGEPRPPAWIRLFGADPAGLGATEFPVLDAPRAWSVEGLRPPMSSSQGDGIFTFKNRDNQPVGLSVKSLWRPFLPAVAEDRAYVHNGIEVRAIDLIRGGETLWTWTSPYADQERNGDPAVGDTPFEPNRVFGATLDGGTLYVLFEVPAVSRELERSKFMDFDVIPPIPRRRLLALDALTGKALWTCGAKEKPLSFLDQVSFSTEPLALDGRLYLAGAVFEGIPTAYVLCLDARDGGLLWKRRIATGSQELNMFGRAVREYIGSPISARAGSLFFSTNLGVVVSLRAEDGAWRWAFRYPSTPRSKSLNFQTYKTPPSWFPNPVVVTADRAVAAPTDSDSLYLLAPDTGSMIYRVAGQDRWGGLGRESSPRDHFYLLGAGDGKAFVHGAAASALALSSGKALWAKGFSEGRERSAGRGALAGGMVFVPTDVALYVFDAKTGDRVRREPWSDRAAEAGNVFLAGGYLLTASTGRLNAYFDQNRLVERILTEARAGRPDPRAAMRAAWVCLRAGRWEDALAFFRRAREAAGAGSVWEEEIRRGSYRAWTELGIAASREAGPVSPLSYFRNALQNASNQEESLLSTLRILEYHRRAKEPAKIEEVLRGMARDFEGILYAVEGEPVPVGLWARFALARLLADAGRDVEAVAELQALIEKSGETPYRSGARQGPARSFAAAEIAAVLKRRGRAPYEAYDALAREAFEKGKTAGSPEALEEVLRLWPNSLAAPAALVDAGRIRLARGEAPKAEEAFRRHLAEFPDSAETAQVLALLVEALARRGALSQALPLLARLRDRHASATVDAGGGPQPAGDWARERLASPEFRDLDPGEVRSDVRWEGAEILWRSDLSRSGRNPEKLLPLLGSRPLEYGSLVLARLGTEVLAVSGRDGSILWSLRDPEFLVQTAGFAGRTLVLGDSSRVRGVDPATGAGRWVRSFPSGWVVRGLALRGRRAAFTATDPSSGGRVSSLWLFAVEGDTGTDLFPPKVIGPRELQSVPELGENIVVAYSRDGEAKVFAFDLAGGRALFAHAVQERLQSVPALFESAGRVVYATRDTVVGLDLSGRKIWSATLGGVDRDGLTRAGPVVVCASTSEHGTAQIAAFDAGEGKALWTAPSEVNPVRGRQAVGRAFIVFGKKGPEVRALRFDRDTGQLEWSAILGGRTAVSISAAFGDTLGLARVGYPRDPRGGIDAADGSFLFFSLSSGKLLRALPHKGSPASDTFTVADGVLVYLERNFLVGWGRRE